MTDGVVIYESQSWPLWLRIVITAVAVALFVVLARRYYVHVRRR